jgi:hypothetical protein
MLQGSIGVPTLFDRTGLTPSRPALVGDPAPQSPPGAAYTRRPHQEGPWPHPARYDLRWEPTQ